MSTRPSNKGTSRRDDMNHMTHDHGFIIPCMGLVAASLVAITLGPSTARAATLKVPGEYATIQDALAKAVSGDTVEVEAGTYSGEVAFAAPEAEATEWVVPGDASGKQIHVILELRDTHPTASLYDYRRIVVDVA